jgi:hypothetical protein
VARKSAGPGTAAAAAETRTLDTLGPRIDREANSSSVSFQAAVAVYGGRECLGHIVARGKAIFEAFDRHDRSVGTFPTECAVAASLGFER